MEAKVEHMIAQADEEGDKARVNFRWSQDALEVVKQAAEQWAFPIRLLSSKLYLSTRCQL